MITVTVSDGEAEATAQVTVTVALPVPALPPAALVLLAGLLARLGQRAAGRRRRGARRT